MEKELYKNIESEGYNLNYYLLDDVHNLGYGIEIEKLTDTNVKEKEAMYDICTEKDKVVGFLEKIVSGSVTPTTLNEVIVDWIDEKDRM